MSRFQRLAFEIASFGVVIKMRCKHAVWNFADAANNALEFCCFHSWPRSVVPITIAHELKEQGRAHQVRLCNPTTAVRCSSCYL